MLPGSRTQRTALCPDRQYRAIGGFQHQQFNYLNAIFNVQYIILGEAPLFKSSIALFGHSVLVESNDTVAIYRAALKQANIRKVSEAVFGFAGTKKVKDKTLELGPYLYPENLLPQSPGFPGFGSQNGNRLP